MNDINSKSQTHFIYLVDRLFSFCSKHELEVIITNTKVPRSTKHLVSKVGEKLAKVGT